MHILSCLQVTVPLESPPTSGSHNLPASASTEIPCQCTVLRHILGSGRYKGKVASPVLSCGDTKHKAFTMSPVTKVRLQDKAPPVKQRSQEQSSGLDGSGRKWGSETSPERHQPWHASKAKSGLRVPATMVYSLPAAG